MARCKHCNKFVLIKRNSGYCKGCEDYLKAESLKMQAREAEEERLRLEAEQTRRLEEARRQAEEAERLQQAEEARLRLEAELARRLEEARRQAEKAERLQQAEETRLRLEAELARRLEEARRQDEKAERLRQEAEEARKSEAYRIRVIQLINRLKLEKEEQLRQEAEEARQTQAYRIRVIQLINRLKLEKEERLRQEAEEARQMEEDRLRAIEWINQLKQEKEERLRLETERKQAFEEAESAKKLEQQRLWQEAEEKQRHQAEEFARLRMILNPKEHLKEQVETLLQEIKKDQADLYVVPRKDFTTIRRRIWDSNAYWQYIAKIHYTTNALSVAVSTQAPEFGNAQHMMAIGFVSADRPKTSSQDQDAWLELFVESSKAEEFFSTLLKSPPAISVEKENDVPADILCPDAFKDIAIEQLALSQRSYNRLKRHGVHTLGALCELSEADLQGFTQLGAVSISEILQRRSEYLAELIEGPSAKSTPADTSALPAEQAPIVNEDQQTSPSPEWGKDISLEQLNLSVRSFNGLRQAGICTLGELCKLSEDDLFSIRNLGRLSVKEILLCRQNWLARLSPNAQAEWVDIPTEPEPSSTPPAECPENGKNIPLNCLGLSVRAYNGLTRSGIKTFGELYKLTEKELSEIKSLGKQSVKDILQCREDWTNKLLSDEVYTDSVEDTEAAEQANRPVRSFIEFLHSLPDERTKTVLLQRALGKTLEEIATQMNVTRERVRQVERKFWKRSAWGAEVFIEEKYVPLLAKYLISEKEFRAIFDEPREVWYIATKLGKRTAAVSLPLEDAVSDETIAAELRTAIQAFCQSIDDASYIEIDGTKVPAIRSSIEQYILSRYCRDEMLIDDFIKKYNAVLIDAGYWEDYLLITKAVLHARYKAIYDSTEVLCSFKRRIRYYPVDEYDIPAFINALHLDSYQDIEISARKLMLDHPDLMEEYDIRNEHELHNLLRKQEVDKSIPGMEFGKMPMIRFGDTDRTSFILDMLFDLAPISKDDFAIAISQKTGERPEFVFSKAEYWNAINVYLHNDMLTIDSEEMPDHEKKALLDSMTEDCYTIEEITRLYKRATGNSSTHLVSTYNLKRMGFKVYSGYAVKNYASSQAYFQAYLTSAEIVDYSEFAARFAAIIEWRSALDKLKDDYTVVEFAPQQLIRMDRLEKFGVSVDDLKAFCNEVYDCVEPGQHFSIHSLRNSGFHSRMFELGFDDWFYSSILREDDRFGHVRLGARTDSVRLFGKDMPEVTRQSFIEYLLDGGSMDQDALLSLIQEDYGIVMDKQDITQSTADSDMYYDPTMEKIYANKELYYEEV